MTDDQMDDLITLSDDTDTLPTSFSSLNRNMATSRPNAVQLDSFSGLTGLMRAKKPYAFVSPATAKPQLAPVRNGTQFASRNITGNSLHSPLASPFRGAGSVAAFLQDQEMTSPTLISSSVPMLGYLQATAQCLESPAEWTSRFDIDHGDKTERLPRAPNQAHRETLLIPELESPQTTRAVAPPTPAESITSTSYAFKSESEPFVRLTTKAWDSMTEDIGLLAKQNRALQEQLSTLEHQNLFLRNKDGNNGTQLGMLRYQNEANRDQKSAMGRTLGENRVQITTQQLELDDLKEKLAVAESDRKILTGLKVELNYLRGIQHSYNEEHNREITAKNFELADVRGICHQQEEDLKQMKVKLDIALRAQVNTVDHATRAQNLADTLASRERVINDLREALLKEELRATDLDDEVEMLRQKVNQENIDDLRTKFQEQRSQCDRQRNQIKAAEQQLNLAQARILKSTNNGALLRGGTHQVTPNPKSKLSKAVVSCVECYTKNLTCDSNAVCRSCDERQTPCARWRCSMKHKLGECPDAPCVVPHDVNGWMVLTEARPEW